MTTCPMRLSSELEHSLFGDNNTARHCLETFPWLILPEGYAFKPVFPYHGAVARFYVCRLDNPEVTVSVYLDVANVLGYVGKPYWEAYRIEGDAARFMLDEGDRLIKAVVAELERRREIA